MKDDVARPYERWNYPAVSAGFAGCAAANFEVGNPGIHGPAFWPCRVALDDLKILITGCDTGQSAHHALRDSVCYRFLGVDPAQASLDTP